MNIQSQKDFCSGLVFMGVGGAFAWGATSYKIGTGALMGPGYFPLILGTLLVVLGAIVIFKAIVVPTKDGEKIGKWGWRPVCYIVAANVAFGILLGGLPSIGLPSMGLVVAIVALTLIAAKAGTEFKLKEVLMLAFILVVGSYVTFILMLKLQMDIWPAFITN